MMSAYAIWLDSSTTPPTATVAQIPNPLHGSNTPVGAYLATQPTPNAKCVGTVVNDRCGRSPAVATLDGVSVISAIGDLG